MLSQRDASTLLLPGDRSTGLDVRAQNVNAALSLANIVKTSLGPLGLDKMMVDDIGEVTITNDGASILKLLEVKHPAAKVLVDLAHQQDEEVGDGTTSVVIIAAELLKRAQDLIVNGLHPTTIITGYRIACKEAVKFIKEHMTVQQQQLTVDDLMAIAKTSMASKILNFHGDYFANMTVNAIKAVEIQVQGKLKYPVNSVNVLKSHGKSAKESIYVDGYALNCTMASQAMPRSIQNAKILCLDMNLQKQRMQMTVQIVIDDPDQIEAIRKRELDITSERISKILATGANVILTTKGIDDMCINYFVDHKTIAVRRVLKEDLKRIAKCTGATILNTLSDLEGNEVIDNSALGYADQVVQERVGDEEVILIKKPKKTPAASIILRGANDFMLEEMERSLHDALCAVRRAMESSSVVPGGGCIEGGVSVFLERFAPTLASREQMAVSEYANALLVIPKCLAVNAAKDATELIGQLRAYHYQHQQHKKDFKHYGLDLFNGKVIDNRKAGVLEPTLSKIKMLKSATEAAISILRIDDMIKLDPVKNEKDEHGH